MSRTLSNRALLARRFYASALALAALSFGLPASADPGLPAEITSDWGLPCTPSCSICHLDASGGPGRIRATTNGNAGFGDNLRNNHDLNVYTPSTWKQTFDDAKAHPDDVDGDGKTDYDELVAGEDPNDPAPGAKYACANAGPEFGCVRVAKQGPVDGVGSVSALVTIFVGVALLRRRRRSP
ncbi:MAG TPA: thrombospondin type 3 repeat-containing protein [Polyangiaceae bacterium]|nr:thrombospondin type 3 repeat-containing protein [Polyangiaceae bacterium]